jgi:DNA transposition AAA+ family ATPase
MQITPEHIPIIQTRALERLEGLVSLIARSAELAIVKGSVGIGKSFAINQMVERAQSMSIRVHTITCRAEIEGNIKSMANEILSRHGIHEHMATNAMQAVWNVVAGQPFSQFGTRSVLIIDEAQGMKISVLEAFRGLFDMGDKARMGVPNAPAFGMILVGNDTFLNRSGARSVPLYAPLRDRVQTTIQLDRPGREEFRAFAAALPLPNEKAREQLVAFGLSKGNLRGVAKAWRLAVNLAGSNPVRSSDLDNAIFMMKGGK